MNPPTPPTTQPQPPQTLVLAIHTPGEWGEDPLNARLSELPNPMSLAILHKVVCDSLIDDPPVDVYDYYPFDRPKGFIGSPAFPVSLFSWDYQRGCKYKLLHDDDIQVVDLYVDVFVEFENVDGEIINFDSDSSIGAMKGLATAIRRRCART